MEQELPPTEIFANFANFGQYLQKNMTWKILLSAFLKVYTSWIFPGFSIVFQLLFFSQRFHPKNWACFGFFFFFFWKDDVQDYLNIFITYWFPYFLKVKKRKYFQKFMPAKKKTCLAHSRKFMFASFAKFLTHKAFCSLSSTQGHMIFVMMLVEYGSNSNRSPSETATCVL